MQGVKEKSFQIQEIEIDLADALLKEPLIARELVPKLERDPQFLDWFKRPCMNEEILSKLEDTTRINAYGEYDNLDFIMRSAWSKQKGIGKSSIVMSIKNYYDIIIMNNGFVLDEFFFSIPEKLNYLKLNAGSFYCRFFVLDEQVNLIGQSSTANIQRMLRTDDVTRIRGFNNAYVSPRGQEWFSHDYFLEAVLKDKKNKTNICCVRARDNTALGWLAVPLPPKQLWERYQEKKIQFTKDVESGQVYHVEYGYLYDKLNDKFKIEEKMQEEQNYYTSFKEWHESNRKGLKPIRPKLLVTPARIKNWLVAVNPEQTAQELSTASEVIFSMLEDKFKGGEKNGA